ncbi:MAG TPA: TIGR01777 family oxidoreductase, partial [Candidatus Tumulicola sp.]
MPIGITGARGFVGSALRRAAARRGWSVRPLSRTPQTSELEGLDAIVHLAGEPIDGRWTPAKKRAIATSRIDGTRRLIDALSKAANPPRAFVGASAVGFYGDRKLEPLDERSRPGGDFLAGVCRDWEAASFGASKLGIRTVVLRTGVALGNGGGALAKMAAPFRFGAGGPLGRGRQFVPWIHVDDLAEMYLTAVSDDWNGTYNAVAPDYATSARLAQAIGAALRRPSFAYAPAPALRLLLGEFANTLLFGQLVLPERAQAAGFQWSHPRLETALQSILAPQRASTIICSLHREQIVAAPLDDVFAFFSEARNLESITPPSLRFAMRTPVPHTEAKTRIGYRLRLHGLPFGWETLISRWLPPDAFIDVQLRGPYALWEHRHSFESRGAATLVRDDVDYVLPLYPLSAVANEWVRRDIEAIFDFR